MNGVVGMAELLQESELCEEQALYVDTIKKSGEALLVIINDILDYSKIEAGKLSLKEDHFDLEQSINEVLTLLLPTAREKGIDLLLDFDVLLPSRYVGDAGRIRQILTNLIGNAVKFTADGHVIVRVVGLEVSDTGTTQLHISVEDTGIGIADGMVDHIFGEFNQVENDRNRKFDGTGLGLSITKQLVELMGGEIWVDSVDGEGSCFGVALTLPRSDGGDVIPPNLPSDLKSVAIIAANQMTGMILNRQLSVFGVNVQCFKSVDAFRGAHAADIDLILAEADMPNVRPA